LNAPLSFGYTLLANTAETAVIVAGLDPVIGFLHVSGTRKASLPLDLLEEFRPLLVDSTVLAALNRWSLTAQDFTDGADGVRLSDAARRRFIEALEARLEAEVHHPVSRERVSYRRCLELQARQVVQVVRGERRDYTPILAR
jgi:CRISP-associated protein Cas1